MHAATGSPLLVYAALAIIALAVLIARYRHIALVVALGTMFGKMMAESGGAERIAQTLITRFGERNAHWAMACIAFLCGLPLFFEVGFVLRVPIAFTIAKRIGSSALMTGLPMVAGLGGTRSGSAALRSRAGSGRILGPGRSHRALCHPRRRSNCGHRRTDFRPFRRMRCRTSRYPSERSSIRPSPRKGAGGDHLA